MNDERKAVTATYYEYFIQKNTVLAGISGFRFIGKMYPKNSWQLGLVYIFGQDGKIPEKYLQPGWEIAEEGDLVISPIPLISYSRKF